MGRNRPIERLLRLLEIPLLHLKRGLEVERHRTVRLRLQHLLDQEFRSRIAAGYFAEWAEVHGNYYGTPLQPVKDSLAQGRDILFDIDVQGAAQISLALPEARFVFILPPSLEELERRLRGRGTDSDESIALRLSHAAAEIRESHWFDALVVNDDLDAAYDRLRAFYIANTLHPSLSPALARAIASA